MRRPSHSIAVLLGIAALLLPMLASANAPKATCAMACRASHQRGRCHAWTASQSQAQTCEKYSATFKPGSFSDCRSASKKKQGQGGGSTICCCK